MARRRWSESDLRAMLALYLDGALDADERAAVEAYLADHPHAGRELAEAARLIDLLDETIVAPAVDEGFTSDVLARVRSAGPGRRRLARLSLTPPLTLVRWLAEACLLVLLIGLFVLRPWAPAIGSVACHLLGDDTWVRGEPAAARVIVRDTRRDAPLANAPVSLLLQQGPRRWLLVKRPTNDEGSVDAEFRLPAELPSGRYTLLARVQSPVGDAVAAHPLTLRAGGSLAVQPISDAVNVGDDVVATVALQGVGDDPASEGRYELRDGRGRRLAGGPVPLTAGLGVVRAPLSEHLPPGPARLIVWAGDRRAERALRLLPPVPPAAEALDLRLLGAPRVAVAGEVWQARLSVDRPPAEPVPQAAVTVRLQVGEQNLVVDGRTDEVGGLDLALPVPAAAVTGVAPERAAAGWLSLAVRAPSGELGRLDLPLPVVTAPLRLEAAAPGPTLVAGLDNTVRLAVRRWDGQPATVALSASWNQQPLPIETDSRGQASLTVHPSPGRQVLRLTARQGEVTVHRRFHFLAEPAEQALLIVPQAARLEPGQAVRLRVLTARSGSLGPVYLDFLAAGRLVATRSLSLRRGRTASQGSLFVTLPSSLQGPVLVRGYARDSRGRWRHGACRLDLVTDPPYRISVTDAETADTAEAGDTERLRVAVSTAEGRPVRAAVLLSAAQPTVAGDALPPDALPPPPAEVPGFTLSNHSVDRAVRRAIEQQRRFLNSVPWLATTAGGLVLLAVLAWAVQLWFDPFEVVTADEWRQWGGQRVRAHRRGAWAGLGVVIAGVAAAGLLALGLMVAAGQANELAAVQRQAPAVRAPLDASPVARLRAAARERWRAHASPPPHLPPVRWAETEGVRTERDGEAVVALPTDPALTAEPWRLRLLAAVAGRPPVVAETVRRPPAVPRYELAAVPALQQGDRVAVPLTIVHRGTERRLLRIEATTEPGLTVTGSATQRVVVEPQSRVALTVLVRADQPGVSSLTVRIEDLDGAPWTRSTEVRVLPTEPRTVQADGGRIDGRRELAFTLPIGATARLAELHVVAEPLTFWDEALAAAATLPVTGLDDALAVAEATAARARLWQRAARDDDARERALADALSRAYQRLLTFEADGGGFAAQPQGAPTVRLTARALRLLQTAEAGTAIDAALLERTRQWLLDHFDTDRGVWLPAGRIDAETGRALPDQASAEALRATAHALWALSAGAAQPVDDAEAAVRRQAGDYLTNHLATIGDLYTLALAANALQAAEAPAAAQRAALERLVEFRTERPDGSHWYPGTVTTLTGATGRGAALETTALAVSALTRASRGAWRDVARQGARWLQTQTEPDGPWSGGWGSPTATVLAVEALATADELPAPARGLLTVSVDDETVARLALGDEAPTFERTWAPEPGRHTVSLSFFGRGRPAFVLRAAFSRGGEPEPPSNLVASARAEPAAVALGGTVTLRLQARNAGTLALPSVLAAVPLPAGFSVAPQQPVVVRDQTALLALGPLLPGAGTTATLRLRAETSAADLHPPEVVVQATYDPGRRARVTWGPIQVPPAGSAD